MSAAKVIVVLAVALLLLPGLAGTATPASGRLEGRLPDNAPVVSIDQPRGTALDAGARLERDRATNRHRISAYVTRDRDGAADGHGLVDGLVGADGERVAEHHALGSVATTPLTPSLAPGIA